MTVDASVSRTSYPSSSRTYLADGRGVAWTALAPNGFRLAIDAELVAQRVPPAVVRRARLTEPVEPVDFWRRWTQAEVLAKLLDVPILLWVRTHRLVAPTELDASVALRTVLYDDLVITFGLAREGAAD
ncbi:hypothetical protein VV02_10615 [Luteipulveratus mongoliensis]|uniref:Uncharacterized protein n=1 Tax=Luteipulveratus mongoliensis TaxID=571913 RepID=A0A0K1JQ23_9MICO|nr:hypothetical protein VV02_10615 [Luteipulveratus mongoliensis]